MFEIVSLADQLLSIRTLSGLENAVSLLGVLPYRMNNSSGLWDGRMGQGSDVHPVGVVFVKLSKLSIDPIRTVGGGGLKTSTLSMTMFGGHGISVFRHDEKTGATVGATSTTGLSRSQPWRAWSLAHILSSVSCGNGET
jgi:hypothetical protein